MNLNIGKALKNDIEIIHYEIDHVNIDPIIYTVHIENNQIYWTGIVFDSVQFEIYNQSKDRNSILLKMISKSNPENITNHSNLNNFLKEKNILDKVRNYKLKKILK